MGREGGREPHDGGDIGIHIADSLVVQQKQTQHCKAIIIQYRYKKKRKKIF